MLVYNDFATPIFISQNSLKEILTNFMLLIEAINRTEATGSSATTTKAKTKYRRSIYTKHVSKCKYKFDNK